MAEIDGGGIDPAGGVQKRRGTVGRPAGIGGDGRSRRDPRAPQQAVPERGQRPVDDGRRTVGIEQTPSCSRHHRVDVLACAVRLLDHPGRRPVLIGSDQSLQLCCRQPGRGCAEGGRAQGPGKADLRHTRQDGGLGEGRRRISRGRLQDQYPAQPLGGVVAGVAGHQQSGHGQPEHGIDRLGYPSKRVERSCDVRFAQIAVGDQQFDWTDGRRNPAHRREHTPRVGRSAVGYQPPGFLDRIRVSGARHRPLICGREGALPPAP